MYEKLNNSDISAGTLINILVGNHFNDCDVTIDCDSIKKVIDVHDSKKNSEKYMRINLTNKHITIHTTIDQYEKDNVPQCYV